MLFLPLTDFVRNQEFHNLYVIVLPGNQYMTSVGGVYHQKINYNVYHIIMMVIGVRTPPLTHFVGIRAFFAS